MSCPKEPRWHTARELAALPLPAPLVRVADGYLVLSAEVAGYPYEIELKRCNTPAKILEWVRHLADKSWATTDLLADFIDGAAAAHDIDIYRGA